MDKTPRPTHKLVKAYAPLDCHIEVKYLLQMQHETRRFYRFVANDRAARWVFVRIHRAKTAANGPRFLRDPEPACPLNITRIFTDNGRECTDRRFGLRKRAASAAHDFDRLCADLGIEHRLAPRLHPQTNGWLNATTAGSKRCCKATSSSAAETSKPPSCPSQP